MINLSDTANDLTLRKTSSEALLCECLARIDEDGSEGSTVFTIQFREQALEQARWIDEQRKAGAKLTPFAGVPVTVKDLFDIAGTTTTAGSIALKEQTPAKTDATVVQRLKESGFVIVGRTNMTEFAYSGLGINPHYGTPRNPYERHLGRIPGGSSSGAAVAISDSFAAGSIATDTGGSCRIPAALCGIVGFKPTARRIPTNGLVPLSTTLDSIGSLSATVEGCAVMDSILAKKTPKLLPPLPLKGIRLSIPQHFVLEDLDRNVAMAFEQTLTTLSEAGAIVSEINLPVLERIPHINRKGGFAAAEAYAWHRELLERCGDQYDPRVRTRIMMGASQSAVDYIELLEARRQLILEVGSKSRGCDALVFPTVPTIAPLISELDDEDTYHRENLLMLRNPSVGNLLDRCSISIPCHTPGDAPVGLMLLGEHGDDQHLLSISAAIERQLLQRDLPPTH